MLTAKEFWLDWYGSSFRYTVSADVAQEFAEAYATYCDHQRKMEEYGVKSIFGEKVVGQK